MAFHLLGNPGRLTELKAVADRHGLLLIEDCAQAFSATYRGRAVGSNGVMGTLKFNEFKTVTRGDGGMIVTDDESMYRRCFALHDQGHSPLRLTVEVGQRPFLGPNLRMIELAGAVLFAQLRILDSFRTRLGENKLLFKSLVRDLPGLGFRDLPDPDGDLVRRAMSIGIGAADPNLGSTFGVTVLDGPKTVRERAATFRRTASKHLGFDRGHRVMLGAVK